MIVFWEVLHDSKGDYEEDQPKGKSISYESSSVKLPTSAHSQPSTFVLYSYILFKIWTYIATMPYSIRSSLYTLLHLKPTHDFAFTFDTQNLEEQLCLIGGKKPNNSRALGLQVTRLSTLSCVLCTSKQLVERGEGWRTGHNCFNPPYVFEGSRITDLNLFHLSLTHGIVPLPFRRADPAVTERCLRTVFHEN